MVHKQLGVDASILVCSTRWSKDWLVDLEVDERRRCRGLTFPKRGVRAFPRSYTLCPLERDDPQEELRVEPGDAPGAHHHQLRDLYDCLAKRCFCSSLVEWREALLFEHTGS